MAASIATIALVCSCQDIKDTYADYAGDGEIRYVGECTNLTIQPGWQRLIVDWENNVDPIIDKVKVKWENDEQADSILLDRGTTEYSIPNLTNSTYHVTVCSLDKNGNSSITSSIYGRPYTEEHEEVKSFTRIIAKQYFLGDHLIMQFSGWQDGIENAFIEYTKKNGEEGQLTLDKELASKPIYELSDEINPSKPITLYRSGRIAGCQDLIEFAPYELEHNTTYSSDFKEFIKTKFGEGSEEMDDNGNIRQDWANNTETIELDTDISSLEDLLNFPKLKKLIIGKNRYLTEEGAEDEDKGQYKIYEPELSDNVLKILNKYQGLHVERYGQHFSDLSRANYIKDMGLAKLPKLDYYDISKAKITVTPEDEEGYNSHLQYLIDGNSNSCWKPLQQTSMTTYQIFIDLGKEVNASGIQLQQKTFSEYDENQSIAPQQVSLEIANNSAKFYDATHVTNNYIGSTTGEIILLPFAKGKQNIRYIRLSVPSQYYHKFYDVTLAEIALYK